MARPVAYISAARSPRPPANPNPIRSLPLPSQPQSQELGRSANPNLLPSPPSPPPNLALRRALHRQILHSGVAVSLPTPSPNPNPLPLLSIARLCRSSSRSSPSPSPSPSSSPSLPLVFFTSTAPGSVSMQVSPRNPRSLCFLLLHVPNQHSLVAGRRLVVGAAGAVEEGAEK